MKKHNLLLLTGILMVLALVLFGQEWWDERLPDDRELWLVEVQNVQRDQVNLILIEESQDESELLIVDLAKLNEVWKVGDFLADAEQIDLLMSSLLTPGQVELVSNNPDRHERLGISTQSAQLTLMQGEQIQLQASLGSVTGRGRYLRLMDRDEVFLVNGLDMMNTSSELEDWVDQVIARVEETEIASISQSYSNGPQLLLSKTEEGWRLEGREEMVERTSISALLNSLQSLASMDFLGDKNDLEAGKELMEMTIQRTEVAEPLVMTFSQSAEEGRVVVSTNERQEVFGMSQALYEALAVEEGELTFESGDEE